MRICLLIPDGIGIRNYLYSDLIEILLKQGHQVVLWHSLDPEMIQITEERIGVKFEQYPFVHQSNNALVQLYREAGRFARIQLNSKKTGNPSILTNWTGAALSKKGKLLNYFAEWMGSRLRTYESIAFLEDRGYRILKNSPEFDQARKLLQEIKPDLLFCTHQRVFSVTPAIEAAKFLKIPTSTAIFSWDNLPKGRLPFRVDQYLVWSTYMKEELLSYYPEIPLEKIQVTGSPQFDFYFKKELLMSREDFASKYNLDLSKEWVCFSGCDTFTSPDDPKFLEDVAESLRKDQTIQLLFRPVPVEKNDRFTGVLDSFPEIKLISPHWVQGSHWGSFFPLFEDIQLLINLAFHCKVVVNMGSTMALDFSTYGNVGLYLRYDHSGVPKQSAVETIYQFQHFRSMGNWKAVGYIYSKEEILSQVQKALKSPNEVAPDRSHWFQKIVEPNPSKSSAERVAEALLSLTSS